MTRVSFPAAAGVSFDANSDILLCLHPSIWCILKAHLPSVMQLQHQADYLPQSTAVVHNTHIWWTRGNKFTLEQAMKAQRRRRDIILLFLALALDGGGWSMPHPSCFTTGKRPVPIVQEAGWAPGPVWMGAENLVPTGIRSQDSPAHSKSLYWLCYPGLRWIYDEKKI